MNRSSGNRSDGGSGRTGTIEALVGTIAMEAVVDGGSGRNRNDGDIGWNSSNRGSGRKNSDGGSGRNRNDGDIGWNSSNGGSGRNRSGGGSGSEGLSIIRGNIVADTTNKQLACMPLYLSSCLCSIWAILILRARTLIACPSHYCLKPRAELHTCNRVLPGCGQ